MKTEVLLDNPCTELVLDHQQYPIYDSEYDVFGCASKDSVNAIPGYRLSATRRFVKEVTGDKALMDRFYMDPFEISVDGTKEDYGWASWMPEFKIWLPKQARTTWYTLHEVAHIIDAKRNPDINHRGCHNWKFASIYLELIREVMGEDEFLMMKRAFDLNGVNYATSLRGKLVLG